MVRLDKFLSNMGVGSRTEVRLMIQKGQVTLEDQVIKKIDIKIDEETANVSVGGIRVGYAEHVYLMLNKPAGYLSATEDRHDQTVLDLVNHPRKKQLHPVGRLDKDTEGLLLLTDDGQLSHRLLSPKWHVSKVYFASISGLVTRDHIKAFEQGVVLEDGYQCMPADLVIKKASDESEIVLTIFEGKFHQVKRMFEALGLKVTYLKRQEMGPLVLDPKLEKGKWRALTVEEQEKLLESGK